MVSIVILTLNEPKAVLACLEKQTYRDFEVILAKEKGIVNAMNRALERAKGTIFVRVDDDVFLPPKWLEELIKPFSDPSIAGVTGPTFIPKERRGNRDSIRWAENPNWFLRWLYDNAPYAPAKIYTSGNVSYGSNYLEHLPHGQYEIDHLEGTNWAMRTELIREVGGFDPLFDGVAEWYDTDVEFEIKKLGYKLHYNREAVMWHMIEKGSAHFNDRFQGLGRIKNWLRFHIRHSKFHPKMVVFLIVWSLYFVWLNFRKEK